MNAVRIKRDHVCKALLIVSSTYRGSVNNSGVGQFLQESKGAEDSNSLGTGLLFNGYFMN